MSASVTQPSISVIIVTFQSVDWIGPCLESLRAQTVDDFEVIVVDNASSDGTPQVVSAFSPFCGLIRNSQNSGFGAACNLGARSARASKLFFLNPDTRCAPDCIYQILQCATEDASVIAPRQLSYEGVRELTMTSAVDILGYPVGPFPGKAFYADGAALVISRELFSLCGSFDEDLFMFHEEIDLCWRVQLLGGSVKAAPDATVFHVSGASAQGGFAKANRYDTTYFRRFHGEKNVLSNLLKNYGAASLLWALPVYFLQSVGEVGFLALLGRWAFSKAVIDAIAWNLTHLRSTIKKRRIVQRSRRVSDSAIRRNQVMGLYKFMLLGRHGVPGVAKR